MNHCSLEAPGDNIIDLRHVIDKRDELLSALREASEQREGCEITEQIDTDLDAAIVAASGDQALLDAAGLDHSDLDYIMQVKALDSDLDGIESAASEEPTMILDEHFEEYAQQLAEDLGLISDELKWPTYHIDWKAAAESLAMDYSEVNFGSYIYLIRAY